MAKHRIFATSFASVYPLYVKKAENKGRTKEEVDRIICWLTSYDRAGLRRQIEQKNDFETFFAQAPAIHGTARSSRAWCAGFGWKTSTIRSCRRSATWTS